MIKHPDESGRVHQWYQRARVGGVKFPRSVWAERLGIACQPNARHFADMVTPTSVRIKNYRGGSKTEAWSGERRAIVKLDGEDIFWRLIVTSVTRLGHNEIHGLILAGMP